MINLSSYVVRSGSGSIDHEATVSKFADDLIAFEIKLEAENADIGQSVHALFDQFKGARLNTPFVVNETLRRLNVKPENYKALTDKVTDYIRNRSQGENSTFTVSKGKGGGIARRCDMK